MRSFRDGLYERRDMESPHRRLSAVQQRESLRYLVLRSRLYGDGGGGSLTIQKRVRCGPDGESNLEFVAMTDALTQRAAHSEGYHERQVSAARRQLLGRSKGHETLCSSQGSF